MFLTLTKSQPNTEVVFHFLDLSARRYLS